MVCGTSDEIATMREQKMGTACLVRRAQAKGSRKLVKFSCQSNSYLAPQVKSTPAEAATLFWFSLTPVRIPGKRVST